MTDTTDQMATGISLPPGTLLGFVGGRPVYNIAGGAEGDDEGLDVEVDTGDEGADPGADGADEAEDDTAADDTGQDAAVEQPKPKPPAPPKKDEPQSPSAAELERTKAALKKANDDARRHRLRNKELEEAARANESEQEKSLREAREEGEKRYRAPLVKAAARAALAEAGVNGSTDRVLRLVDTEGLSVDDDGDVIGLEAEIDRVRQEYPEFFQKDKPKPKPRPTAAGKEPSPEKPRSAAEQHAARVLGRTG